MKILNPIGSFLKRVRTSWHQDPVRDWLMLLSLSAIALVSIVFWNIWAFNTVAQGGVIGSIATSSPSVFSRSSLDAIRTIFAERAAEESKYESGGYSFADPSQ